MRALVLVIDFALAVYVWILLAAAVLSWLIGFNVVSADSKVVALISELLSKASEPVRRPLRFLLPDLGGADISPIVGIAIIVLGRYALRIYLLSRLS